MRLQFLLGEIWTGLRRNLSIAVSVMLVTMVSLYLLGLGLLLQREVDTLKGYWYDRIQVSIFMCGEESAEPNCAGAARHRGAEGVAADPARRDAPLVKDVFYESEQQAYDRFQQQFRNSPLADNDQMVAGGPVGWEPASEALSLRGVLCKETQATTLRVAPPLVITRDEIDLGVQAIAEVVRPV